jgi:hypothetical protein
MDEGYLDAREAGTSRARGTSSAARSASRAPFAVRRDSAPALA